MRLLSVEKPGQRACQKGKVESIGQRREASHNKLVEESGKSDEGNVAPLLLSEICRRQQVYRLERIAAGGIFARLHVIFFRYFTGLDVQLI